MQTGMKIDSKTPECRKFLVKLMDQLEIMKKQLGDNESITQDVVGNAHIENYAYKMFLYADTEDRAGRFHKNMIKSFYTASLLYDVLTVFGELTEENIQHRKYAKWKAAYIHNCLKNGETPNSGPLGMETEFENEDDVSLPQSSDSNNPVADCHHLTSPTFRLQLLITLRQTSLPFKFLLVLTLQPILQLKCPATQCCPVPRQYSQDLRAYQ
ncbi:vacuolar protein sorting-associated protein VTA1 homolog isoform X2 [Amblyraja radiata]|nr:vacuolar protein sorting-associated protein VTA1 homolog isoform X2 [Amblyraja radiata]